MSTRLTGSWSRRTQVDTNQPLTSQPDPEHLNPSGNTEFTPGQTPAWANTAPAPDLPVQVLEDQLLPLAMMSGGPLDHTPIDHGYGMGTGPGLDTLTAQDYRMAWHSDDQGAVAAHQWNTMMDRDDRPGSPHVDFIEHFAGDGDSPHTLELERTGAGRPNDPNARLGRWFRRWRDREIDMHRFPVEYRPLVPRYARGAQAQPPVPDGSQTTGPYATAVTEHLGPVDTFVGPLVRRIPGPWDEGMASDGTAYTLAGAVTGYGLTQWGM